jgi:hypothetical protein
VKQDHQTLSPKADYEWISLQNQWYFLSETFNLPHLVPQKSAPERDQTTEKDRRKTGGTFPFPCA